MGEKYKRKPRRRRDESVTREARKLEMGRIHRII